MGISEDTSIQRFDASGHDVIVFDEILLVDTRKLAKILRYANRHPDKIVLSTGDENQLEPVEPMTNTHADVEAYSNECVNQIFPYQLYLRENKRLRTSEDKQTLRDFKRDIFNEDIPIETTVRKYFPVLERSETDFNIAYYNDTCATVARMVRRRMKKATEYEVGETLVCRAYIKAKRSGVKAATLFKNYEYKITELTADTLTLDDHTILPLTTVRKCFIHNYCRTCHSFQGLSVNVPITIYDWKCEWASRKWVYTAVTRARQLDQVHFKEYTYRRCPKDVKDVADYMQKKVAGYKYQDTIGRHEICPERYITPAILMGWLGKPCHNCGDCLMWERGDKGAVVSNLTAQRLNNDIAHEVDNIIPYCTECNRAMSNRE